MAEINRELLGVWGPEGTMKIEFGKIMEFAKAVKDSNPIYRNEALCVAPPTFLMTISHWIGDLGATRLAVKLDRNQSKVWDEGRKVNVVPLKPSGTSVRRAFYMNER